MSFENVCRTFLDSLPQGEVIIGDLHMLVFDTVLSDEAVYPVSVSVHYRGKGRLFLYEKVRGQLANDQCRLTSSFEAPFSLQTIQRVIHEHIGAADYARIVIGGEDRAFFSFPDPVRLYKRPRL